jgi:citrate lyase alpha subunit
VDKLESESEQFSERWKALAAVIEQPDERALAPAPEIDLPFMAEISVGSDGTLRTASAVLREASA